MLLQLLRRHGRASTREGGGSYACTCNSPQRACAAWASGSHPHTNALTPLLLLLQLLNLLLRHCCAGHLSRHGRLDSWHPLALIHRRWTSRQLCLLILGESRRRRGDPNAWLLLLLLLLLSVQLLRHGCWLLLLLLLLCLRLSLAPRLLHSLPPCRLHGVWASLTELLL